MRCTRRSSLRNELFHWPSFSLTKKTCIEFFVVSPFSSLLVMPESARVLFYLALVWMTSRSCSMRPANRRLARERYINVKDCTKRKYGQRAMVRTSSLKLFYFFFRVLLIIRLVPTAFFLLPSFHFCVQFSLSPLNIRGHQKHVGSSWQNCADAFENGKTQRCTNSHHFFAFVLFYARCYINSWKGSRLRGMHWGPQTRVEWAPHSSTYKFINWCRNTDFVTATWPDHRK